MAPITIQVLDGADRGRILYHPTTPVTIGREEGNIFQLNDERVSRYHLKIQEDHDKVVLTDLESTNGTKVNGEDIQVRILRYGDIITIGRSVLLFGSREQIASRLMQLKGLQAAGRTLSQDTGTASHSGQPGTSGQPGALDFDMGRMDAEALSQLNALEAPSVPERLSPAQAAQLAEIFEYFQIQVRHLINSVQLDDKCERVTLDMHRWQALLDMQFRLGSFLREIGEPESRGGA